MKISKLLLLVVAALLFSCGKDDDEPSLDKRTLSFSGNEQVIAAPAAMQDVEDEGAQTAVNWINQANAMSQYLSYMQIPSGATKSGERITAANGRVSSAGDFVVYTWSDNQGTEIAYQVSETSDSFVFELFIILPDQPEWTKYFHAEEKKDKSSGFMKVYDAFYGDDASVVLFSYTWSRSGDEFTLTISDGEDSSVKLVINEKTKAGKVTYTSDGLKEYEIIWDAAGNGTWATYDEEGNLDDEGSWTV